MGFTVHRGRRLYEAALRGNETPKFFREHWQGLREGHITPFVVDGGRIVPGPDYDQYRSDRLFEHFVHDASGSNCGLWAAREMRESRHGSIPGMGTRLTENSVMTSAFTNIIGQISFSATLDAFANPAYIASQLHTVEPASTLYEEMIPGVGLLGDHSEAIGENEEYPEAGMTSEFITIGRKKKRGFQVSVSEEAAWEDKTGLIMRRAESGIEAMLDEYEREHIDLAAGVTQLYSRNGGPKQATYAASHTQGDFDNLLTSTPLVDWTDIESALLKFDAMSDPNTGRPILVPAPQILVPTALSWTAARILNATEVEHVDNQANSATIRTRSRNPISQSFQVVTSPYVSRRTSSSSTWFIGDFKGAFGYSEVWPVQTFTQDRSSESGFARDVIARIKWRRMGVPFVREPRKAVKVTA